MTIGKSTVLKWFDLNKIIALSAIFVSVVSLYVAWDQSRIMRQQQHASAMPIIMVEMDFIIEDEFPTFKLRIRNDGVGPGFVKSGALQINGKQIETFSSFSDAILPTPLRKAPTIRLDVTKGVLAPGMTRVPLRMVWKNKELAPEFIPFAYSMADKEKFDISYQVCYCSIYDQCWVTDIYAQAMPEKIKSCPVKQDLHETFMTKEK